MTDKQYDKANPIADQTSSNISKEKEQKEIPTKKPPKPPKPEDKPFEEFINTELIPSFSRALEKRGIANSVLTLSFGERPVVGGECWMLLGEISEGRRFWLCFNENKITSNKTIALAEEEVKPSLLESFLIDEKKTTLSLLVSRLLQRLNGQKWLGHN